MPSPIRPRAMRAEFIGGLVIMAAALAGLIAANSPLAESFLAFRATAIGPAALGLDLTVGEWASDGLLAIFFFVVGLELKREFAEGALRSPAVAVVPIAAAFGGVVVPALLYVAFTAGTGAAGGWAIPTATDIAFAVAVLGLIAPRIAPALRVFLLTLAVVDDFIAIAVIAVFYAHGLHLVPLLLSLAPIAAFGALMRWRGAWFARSPWAPWLILLPIGAVSWALFHGSGIHATIAAIALAFLVPVRGSGGAPVAERMIERFQPLSSYVAVPVFAFFAAGVPLGAAAGFPFGPVALGIVAGLVIGKPLGICLTVWLLTRFTRATLGPGVRWREVIGVGAVAGVGFTVAMLIAELSFAEAATADTARLAVMAGSALAALLAAAILLPRARRA